MLPGFFAGSLEPIGWGRHSTAGKAGRGRHIGRHSMAGTAQAQHGSYVWLLGMTGYNRSEYAIVGCGRYSTLRHYMSTCSQDFPISDFWIPIILTRLVVPNYETLQQVRRRAAMEV
jgi:hypothetical protein